MYNKEDLLAIVAEYDKKHGKVPTQRELRSVGVSEDPFHRVFGSYSAAQKEYSGLKEVFSGYYGPTAQGVYLDTPEHPTTLVIPDAHVSPGQDLSRFAKVGQLILDYRPSRIIFLGDFVTLESLSNWDLTKSGNMEGKRYAEDMEVGREALRLVLAPLRQLQAQQTAALESVYYPQLVFLKGNHECVSTDTEILTDAGWVLAEEVTSSTKIASFNTSTKDIQFAAPVAIKSKFSTKGCAIDGNFHDELISDNHNIFLDGQLIKVTEAGTFISQNRFTYAGNLNQKYHSVNFSEDWIRLLTWVISDATIVVSSPGKKRIQFKLSKERKISTVTALLTKMKIPFTFKLCKKSGLNVLQPYYIRIYGEDARYIHSVLEEAKQFPEWFKWLSYEQALACVDALHESDGNFVQNINGSKLHYLSTTSKWDADIIQQMCIFNGIPARIDLNVNASGFKAGKIQYRLAMAVEGVYWRNKVNIVPIHHLIDVVAIQSIDGTLITRRNGKVAFTGNCRLERYLETRPELKEHLNLVKDLGLRELGFSDVVEYRDSIEFDGVLFTHAPQNAANQAVSGKYAIHRAAEMTAKSVVFGHTHRFEAVNYYRHGSGELTQLLMAGAFFEHTEDYAYGGLNAYYRGLVMLTHWKEGRFDVENISLERLHKRY